MFNRKPNAGLNADTERRQELERREQERADSEATSESQPNARRSARVGKALGVVVSIAVVSGVFIFMRSAESESIAPIEPASCDPDLWSTATQGGERNGLTIAGLNYAFRYCPPTGDAGFMMGSPENEKGRHYGETQHKVVLSKGFWLLETEVTQRLWQEIMGDVPSVCHGEERPVENVNWFDVCEFVQKLNEVGYAPEGYKFSLPTEAQWEYACRAGSSKPYGETPLGKIGWYKGNARGVETFKVALKRPNSWGLYDMHGNVWEWCYDSFVEDLQDAADPVYDEDAPCRVARGGCWGNSAQCCRAAYRFNCTPDNRDIGIGARLALVRVD